MELHEISEKVDQGISLSGLFGNLTGTTEEMIAEARNEYRALIRECHPDLTTGPNKRAAEEITKAVNQLYAQVKNQVLNGVYDPANPPREIAVISTTLHDYQVPDAIATGEVATIYKATYTGTDGLLHHAIIKIALDPADNNLMYNEQMILDTIARQIPEKDRVAFPELIDTFTTPDGRAGSVMKCVQGYDFDSLMDHPLYEKGIHDPYHLGWIMERVLAALGHLHSHMIVHGNIEPRHLMLVPDTHNVVLLDFCFAVLKPGSGEYIRIKTPKFSAPEISKKASPHPRMDLYGLGKCMIHLMGGNPQGSKVPDDIPVPLGQMIKHLTERDTDKRADDAWEVAHRLFQLREEFGRSNFRPLPI